MTLEFVARLGALAVITALGAGCSGVPGEDGSGAGDEDVGSTTEAALNDFAVGIIPVGPGGGEGAFYGTTCPNGSELATIYMDDEDDGNMTMWGSWRLPQDPDPVLRIHACSEGCHWNTPLRFCKVAGTSFKPRTTDVNDKANFYAVLKLGINCPAGSTQFTRYIDNEDDRNENSQSGPIAPNVSNQNTTLTFCFFRNGTSTMADFPNLGIQYAVYHDFEGAQPFPYNIEFKGKHMSDDEDNGNENGFGPAGTSAAADFIQVIGIGKNTTFDIGRVW